MDMPARRPDPYSNECQRFKKLHRGEQIVRKGFHRRQPPGSKALTAADIALQSPTVTAAVATGDPNKGGLCWTQCLQQSVN
jgi:hypothetical protein